MSDMSNVTVPENPEPDDAEEVQDSEDGEEAGGGDAEEQADGDDAEEEGVCVIVFHRAAEAPGRRGCGRVL